MVCVLNRLFVSDYHFCLALSRRSVVVGLRPGLFSFLRFWVRSDCVSPLLARKKIQARWQIGWTCLPTTGSQICRSCSRNCETLSFAVPFIFPQPVWGSALANFENPWKSSPLEKLLCRPRWRDPNVFSSSAHAPKHLAEIFHPRMCR